MRNITLAFFWYISFALLPFLLRAQSPAPDEETGPYTTCNPEGQNTDRNAGDLANPVNVGTIDDRSCYANYQESTVYGSTWGVYNITFGSNHLDAPNTLQPRIERSLPRSMGVGVGSYARFTGTVRILEVGDTTGDNNDGTYIMQAKGKHIGGGGPPDPAICLYLAKPVYGPDSNGNQVQVSFDLYREQINFRGGSGASGRQIVFLTNIPKDVPTDIELEVGFRQNPNDSTQKIHYADAVIGGLAFNWNIPEPGRGTQSGIRYGVYRVKGGRAQIRWANTTYQKAEVAGTTDPIDPDPVPEIVRLRNVATGKYVASSGSTIITSDTGAGADKEWQLVMAGLAGFDYYNIDSEVRGIMRFKGGSSAPELISTNFTSPNTDVDKLWTLIEHADGSVSFETRNLGRYLYHAEDGTMTHADTLDDRAKWILESTTTVNVGDKDSRAHSLSIYPNPSEGAFTISFESIRHAQVSISDPQGKVIYQTSSQDGRIELSKADGLSAGLYVVQVSDGTGQTVSKKLVIK